jgi:pyrimidine operon attenuation protein / uracil phosphoribosyltransferase
MAAILSENRKMDVMLERLCYELIENHGDFSGSVLLGMQPRGIYLSRHLKRRLEKILDTKLPYYGELDITFYRDDFRRGQKQLVPSEMNINFSIEGKNVVLADDVIYTGRTLRAALDALLDFGRAARVEYLALVDRRFRRQLPVEPDYIGMSVDSRSSDRVRVEWEETDGANKIWLLCSNNGNSNESPAN